MKLFCRRHMAALRPIDGTGLDELMKISPAEIFTVTVKRSRNIKHHRMYWALIGIVWDNIDHAKFPSTEHLHRALKWACGIREEFMTLDGEIKYQLGSIAFDNMDQTEFSKFYDQVCDLLALNFMPGASEELKKEVESMIGVHDGR